VVDSEPATASAGVPALRERVEREEGVRRVVEVFGGRIDTIEETR